MDELEIRNLHFLGYSLGALVGFELLLRHPERMRIVMLAGESPFLSVPMQQEWNGLAEEIAREGLSTVRARRVAEQRLVAAPAQPELEGEQQAALALLAGLCAETPRPDMGRLSVDTPVALFAGESDPALERLREARRRIHRARFVSFPRQSHAGLFHERQGLIAEVLRLLRPGRRSEGTGPSAASEGGPRPEGEHRERTPSAAGAPPEPHWRPSLPLTPPPPVDVPPRPMPPAHADRPESPAPQAPPAEAAHVSAAQDPPHASVATQAHLPDLERPPPPQNGPEADPSSGGASAGHDADPTPAEESPPEALPGAPQAGEAGGLPSEDAPEDIPVRARQEEEQPPEPSEPDPESEAPWLRGEHADGDAAGGDEASAEPSAAPGALPDAMERRAPPPQARAEEEEDEDLEDWSDEEDDPPAR
jgi:hypothetical protein